MLTRRKTIGSFLSVNSPDFPGEGHRGGGTIDMYKNLIHILYISMGGTTFSKFVRAYPLRYSLRLSYARH